MNIYVYSDESGVFDKGHNTFFVYGGLIFLAKDDCEVWKRKYLHNERNIRKIERKMFSDEIKATTISNKSKGKLYRSLNNTEKFGIVVNQKDIYDSIFTNKKTKQRYLDYAYKMGVKHKLKELIRQGKIVPKDVENIYFFVDEHTTATNGRYELCESLETELKLGTHNWNFSTYYPPLFPNIQSVQVLYCNSQNKTLIRAADIVANRLFYCSRTNTLDSINFPIKQLP